MLKIVLGDYCLKCSSWEVYVITGLKFRENGLSELCKHADCGKEFSRKSYPAEHQWKHVVNVLFQPLGQIKNIPVSE